MDRFLLPLLLLFTITCNAQKNATKASAEYRHAQQLLKDKDYFNARDYISINDKHFSKFERLVLQANTDNIFNRASQSNEKIVEAFNKFPDQLSDSLQLSLRRLKHANHARLFQYAEANAVVKDILATPTRFLDAAEIADYYNMGNIWTLLAGQPKQEVIVSEATFIKMKRDKAQLTNLPVKAGNVTIDFIFDTGANLSTVTETTAVKLGMKILGGSIQVGSITGATVNAKMAICPQFTIGSITIKNAVFLVFPDSALAFPQIDYQINGIIGFPVIEAMKEIQVTQEDEFIVPKNMTAKSGQEMALDFLTPVIKINDEYYTFDTGAVSTSLYTKYLEKHKDEIIGAYKETDLDFGGAGGMTTKRGYSVNLPLIINSKQLTLEGVQLFTEKIDSEESHFYGNIGQDLIKQFQKMTINFSAMFVKFD
ncbi:retropepsin-like aspartic protease [Flavobacterium sp. DGU11]|uniref:Retropepsin-like aspartic protease n=1 Tax=Flavobacterium arundinis TaxID=3139143 RepID=A0ABU9HW73_9FLAO